MFNTRRYTNPRRLPYFTLLLALSSHTSSQLSLAATVSEGADQQFGTLSQELWSADSKNSYKHKLKSWLFKCTYSRRRIW